MSKITALSVQAHQQLLAIFADLFTREFLAEMNYLDSVARGNIDGRKDASLVMLVQVTIGLASLVPVPGVALAVAAAPHAVKSVINLATKVWRNEWTQAAWNMV